IWCSVYPTTLMFTRKLSDDIYLPAKYSIVLGLGDMLTGFVIGAVCKRVHNFSKLPTLTIGCISFSTAMTLVLLSTPTWSTTTPNDDGTLLIEPNFYLPLLIAFLFGIGDNCVNTSRTVICALILHEKRAQVFSISKFHQSLIGAVVMFLSPFFSVYVYFALMLGLGISSCELVFFYEANLEINKKVVSDFEKKVLRMRESRYDLLCAILLGLGQLCMFLGYDTQLTIVEPVVHSVHDRSPWRIDAHGGYYGLASCCIISTLANLAAPWALGILGSKYALLLGSSLFTLHIATFLYVHWIPYYLTSALLGFGYALFYTGHAAYTTEHSTKRTIERNSAVTWSLATVCMTIGGLVLLFTIKPPSEEEVALLMKNTTNVEHRSYRVYSDSEIRLMYGAFLAVAVCSNLIFAFIPTRAVNDSIAKVEDSRNGIAFGTNIKRTFSTMPEKYMIQLVPLFGYIGMAGCIWCSVYPTTLMFTKELSGYIYLPAYYSIGFGLSDMLMGFLIGAVCKRVRNFSKLPTLTIGCVSFTLAMILVLLSTPSWATMMPTDEETLVIEPNFYLPLLIAVLFGIGDNCVNTSRTVICALILHEKRAQVFSISKFHQ
ncbi:hypothetical protein PMAYCL1PPCAC_15179, partial [Pristionchus mayeri]